MIDQTQGAAPMLHTPDGIKLYRQPDHVRTATAERFVGRRVRVTYALRSGRRFDLVGELLAGAILEHGTTSDVVVVREDGGRALAVSGATVESITELPSGGAR